MAWFCPCLYIQPKAPGVEASFGPEMPYCGGDREAGGYSGGPSSTPCSCCSACLLIDPTDSPERVLRDPQVSLEHTVRTAAIDYWYLTFIKSKSLSLFYNNSLFCCHNRCWPLWNAWLRGWEGFHCPGAKSSAQVHRVVESARDTHDIHCGGLSVLKLKGFTCEFKGFNFWHICCLVQKGPSWGNDQESKVQAGGVSSNHTPASSLGASFLKLHTLFSTAQVAQASAPPPLTVATRQNRPSYFLRVAQWGIWPVDEDSHWSPVSYPLQFCRRNDLEGLSPRHQSSFPSHPMTPAGMAQYKYSHVSPAGLLHRVLCETLPCFT